MTWNACTSYPQSKEIILTHLNQREKGVKTRYCTANYYNIYRTKHNMSLLNLVAEFYIGGSTYQTFNKIKYFQLIEIYNCKSAFRKKKKKEKKNHHTGAT